MQKPPQLHQTTERDAEHKAGAGQSAGSNPWCLKPVHRCPGQSAVEWCIRFYNTYKGTTYADGDLSKMLNDTASVDKDIQHLVNTRQNTISAWQALQHTISGVQKTIAQA